MPTWPIPKGAPITPMLLSARWETPRRTPARPLQGRPTFKRDVFILLKWRAGCWQYETAFRLMGFWGNLANQGNDYCDMLNLTTCRQWVIRKTPPLCDGQ